MQIRMGYGRIHSDTHFLASPDDHDGDDDGDDGEVLVLGCKTFKRHSVLQGQKLVAAVSRLDVDADDVLFVRADVDSRVSFCVFISRCALTELRVVPKIHV